MPRRVLQITFCCLFSLALAGPVIILICELADVKLPFWATAEGARYLSGGIEESDLQSCMSVDGFASGAFQSAMAVEVGNRIPFKAQAMLGNAALQRSAIAAANAPFGYPCYPTYFGSSRLHLPAYDAVTYLPEKRSGKKVNAVRRVAKGMAAYADRHPDARVALVMAWTVSKVISLAKQALAGRLQAS